MPAPGSARVLRARFSARAGATTALSRATAIFAAIFMINSLVLAYLGTRTAAAAAAHDCSTRP